LTDFLRVVNDDGTITALPPGSKVSFTFSVRDPDKNDLNSYKNRYGFTPHFSDGSVDLDTTPTDKHVNNFVIIASAENTGSPSPLLVTTIRIHIHEIPTGGVDGRSEVRLQPNPLHLRKGTALRFTVLAKFSHATTCLPVCAIR
jgi:hypothetical protein